jgi:membrane peptidoglycan carboxypeptidase
VTHLFGLLLLLPARLAVSLEWGPVGPDVERVLDAHLQSRPLPLPVYVTDMVVSVEDRRFYRHAGVDLRGIARALVNNLKGRPVQGGSTLEQQLVRSVTNARDLTLRRKVREAMAAAVVASLLPKREVADLLLRHCWFGHEMAGAEAYAKANGISLEDLTPQRAAEMVARIRYPEYATCSAAYVQKIHERAAYILRLHLSRTR